MMAVTLGADSLVLRAPIGSAEAGAGGALGTPSAAAHVWRAALLRCGIFSLALRCQGDMAHILVIDNDQLVRSTIQVALEFEGHTVVLAHDAQDGIREFGSRPFDLVICDVFMPDLSGLETISEIRGLSATAPIIAMTGGFAEAPETRFSSDLLRIARHNGTTLRLTKPFRRDDLIALVRHCLRRA
jgi:CheY-like chemotaxis protein